MSEKLYQTRESLQMPKIETEIAQFWQDQMIFDKSITNRNGAIPFVFYEGPPSANGLPGIHHVISRTLKDLVCRYKTMKGYQVHRKAGWDTHGLPVELGVEKKLGITKKDIGTKISIEEYNKECREEVMKYKHLWDELTTKMGYWVDLNHPYITFENEYIETLWWILHQLYQKDYLYKSISIQPYSPAAGTGLSSHELNMPGSYRDVKDTSVTALFELDSDKNKTNKTYQDIISTHPQGDICFMAWTTTPWTLPSNVGLTVGDKIEYQLIQTVNPYTHQPIAVILAKNLVTKYFDIENQNKPLADYARDGKNLPWSILGNYTGSQLTGLYYHQLLPYVQPENGDPFRVVSGDFVTTEDGTGIVHTAPAFGADDYKVGQKNNLGILLLVDREGKFVDTVGEFGGRYVKDYTNDPHYVDVNVDIAVKLKQDNRAFKVEKYNHNYPHCWRTDKPIIYYPLDAWFIKTTAVKDRMIELNQTINWKPESTGTGRFGNWLENVVDWNLSRSRFWGTPLPIWTTEDQEEKICIGSLEELTNLYLDAKSKGLNKNVDFIIKDGKMDIDLHKPFVDDIELMSPTGRVMRRVPDLIDVWFDSGAMPYAQWHYPFENVELFQKNFPADFIAEGVDQTRGWFYTLHVLATMLFDSVAYKNVISNGLVLDSKGDKMSKSKGNVVDPFETIAKYSADATRWYLITNAAPWESNKFDVNGLLEVQRKFFGTLFNTYQFFALYANLDKFKYSEKDIPLAERAEIDQWIISSLHTCVKNVTQFLDDYEPTKAFNEVGMFLDEKLSNWYVRLCRRRFWKGEYEADKIAAYQTLYECLDVIAKMIAPISPYFADWLYRSLNQVTERNPNDSVHLSDFPESQVEKIDQSLEDRMDLAMNVTSLILSIRKKEKIKVRQPLQKVLIPVLDQSMKSQLEKVEDLILREVNVKEIEYLFDTEGVISKKVKPDFKKLGSKLGKDMKSVAQILQNLNQKEITELESKGFIAIPISDTQTVEIKLDEVEIQAEDISGWSVASNGPITLALDIHISPELEEEGIARELINKVQNIRKDMQLELNDRIELTIQDVPQIKNVIDKYKSYICGEILADRLQLNDLVENGLEFENSNFKTMIQVSKI